MSLAEPPPLRSFELLRRLSARGVDFVVIGGIALVLHGSTRITKDLDICFATDAANLGALGDVLLGLNARLRGVDEDLPFVPDADTLRRVEVLTLETDHGWMDVLARPAGAPPYAALQRHAERYDLDEFAVMVASIDDLIAMKTAAGRPRDIADIAELETIARLRRRSGDAKGHGP